MADTTLQEPLLEVDDIQGNSLAGFKKDHQCFLFFQMDRTAAGLAAVRTWFQTIGPQVSTLAQVHAFNKQFKDARLSEGFEPLDLKATWLNLALSADALRALTSDADVDQFTDDNFKAGLAAVAFLLNDPIDANGAPIGWKVGGVGKEADVLVIIASDDPEELKDVVAQLHGQLAAIGASHGTAPLILIWEDVGQTLPGELRGHEHFGFKDGISQPGIRGLVRADPPEFFTERLFDASVQQNDPALPEFSRPGRPLVWPGQFIFGYDMQSTEDPRNPLVLPAGTPPTAPEWARNGTYVVVRRLRQDVKAFREFTSDAASRLQLLPAFAGMNQELLASKLVGRWPSGAPLMRTPTADDPALAADPLADNFFQYQNDSPPPMPITPDLPYAGDTFPTSIPDLQGRRCPLAGHVRKVNPRDGSTEQGSTVDVLARLVLRRGVPFGEAYDAADPAVRDSEEHDRGLIFVSYQTSIERQFIFLQRNWCNNDTNPNRGVDQGIVSGQDGIIGQVSENGRVRTITIAADDGSSETLTLDREWVIPTGGGFFFSPSISTLINVLGQASTA